jgi:hypothetical protein
VLLAAAVTAIASVAVALITVLFGGSSGTTGGTPSANYSPASTSSVSIAITGLLEQPHPPPPGREYIWTGTVSGQPTDASVFIIDKRPGEWLVSPAAVISVNGGWTVTWVIPAPPVSAQWVAAVYIQAHAYCVLSGCPPAPSGSGLSEPISSVAGVIAVAPYQLRAA